MWGKLVIKKSLELKEGIPLVTVPIPGRVNPVLIVPTNRLIKVSATIRAGGNELLIKGIKESTVKAYVSRFYNELMRSTGVSASIELTIDSIDDGISNLFKYAALTSAIINVLAGELNDELLEAAAVVDNSIGVWCLPSAARFSAIHSMPYIWRRGEGVIESECGELSLNIFPINKEVRVRYVKPFDEDLITKVAGLLTIKAFRVINECLEDISDLKPLIRAGNSLWHLIYGVGVDPDLGSESELTVLTGSLINAVIKYRVSIS